MSEMRKVLASLSALRKRKGRETGFFFFFFRLFLAPKQTCVCYLKGPDSRTPRHPKASTQRAPCGGGETPCDCS